MVGSMSAEEPSGYIARRNSNQRAEGEHPVTPTEQVAINEQIAEVKRELAMRHQVYQRRIASGKMTPGQAKYFIRVIESVLTTLTDHKRLMEAKL
jgi:hypothetical protein